MIYSKVPICPLTYRPAKLFCCTSRCHLPAFSCSEECFTIHKDHDFRLWTFIQQPIKKLKDQRIPESQLKQMEKQEKQLLILIEQLKTLHQNHFKLVGEFRSKLKLREQVQRVIDRIGYDATEGLTGDDMARFVKLIEENDAYANQKQIQQVVFKCNIWVDQLIQKLYSNVNNHKTFLSRLRKPGQFTKISAEIDLSLHYSYMTTQINGMVSVKNTTSFFGVNHYYPIYLNKPLCEGDFYEVQVINVAKKSLYIGVAPATVKNILDKEQGMDVMWISAKGKLFVEQKKRDLGKGLVTGDRIMVRSNGKEIQWFKNGISICAAPIPSHLLQKHLFPVCWIYSWDAVQSISEIRFL